MNIIFIWLLFGSALVICPAYSSNVEINRSETSEVFVYKWDANVNAGSLLPTEHTSTFGMSAIVTIIKPTNYTYSYTLQIGNVTWTNANHKIGSLEKEVVIHRSEGEERRSWLEIDSNDELWSINMKRSLIALFNVHVPPDMGTRLSVEETPYGTCNVETIITESKDKERIVRKVIDENSCSNSPNQIRTNAPYFRCSNNLQEAITSHLERTYKFSDDLTYFPKHVSAISSLHFQPFEALAESYYVFGAQSLELVDRRMVNTSISTPYNSSDYVRVNVTYQVDSNHEPTSGQIPADKQLLRAVIYSLLEEVTESLNWQLSTEKLDNQTAFHLLELMWSLSVEDWETLYEMVVLGTSYKQETMQHLFWDLLPQVGSEASVDFIKRLVTNRERLERIGNFIASGLLSTFPLHIRNVSEVFLMKSEDLLRMECEEDRNNREKVEGNRDTLCKDIKNLALLSFASMVRKAHYYTGCCNVELIDRYTKFYLDKFMETNVYEDRMMYLQALNNMNLSRIMDFLSPIITNPSYSRHIRYMAIWSTLSAAHKQVDLVTEKFWPIFLNRTEPLEIRISAMAVLLTTEPTVSRLQTFYWYMRSEPNYQIYNYFYTTIQSFSNTKYPCYAHIRNAATRINRYLWPRAYRWATANHILDYEDSTRGYGGLIHLSIVASEYSGLPSNIFLMMEQHSHGTTSRLSFYVKLEGIADSLRKEFFNPYQFESLLKNGNLSEYLSKLNLTVKVPEKVHFEIIVRVDGLTIYCQYLNEFNFADMVAKFHKASSLYYEFSVNYQRLRFPQRLEFIRMTDLGTPVSMQVRTVSLLSLRGSINQAEYGNDRDAELDFRYSIDTVTSLRALNPCSKEWHGTDRTRSLHAKIPFSTHLLLHINRYFFKLTANRHKDFVDGSLLGAVWHSTIKLFPNASKNLSYNQKEPENTRKWSINSRDLGAKLTAEIFDCPNKENSIFDSITTFKEAFQTNNKNYKMITGGAMILGLFSLSNYFTFLPPGESCGLGISVSPLQVQLILLREGDMLKLSMTEQGTTIWELTTFYREQDNGYKQLSFILTHTERNRTILANEWRLIDFQGQYVMPSIKSGLLKAPGPFVGHASVSWGEAESSTQIFLDVRSDNVDKNWPANCEQDTTMCLQLAGNLDTQQTISMQCANLPIWVTTTLISLFPTNIHTHKNSTNIRMTLPAKIPWTHQGVCAVNVGRVLNFDNATVFDYAQSSECYSIAVMDCSIKAQFIVGIKKSNDKLLKVKILVGATKLELLPPVDANATSTLFVNGTEYSVNNKEYKIFPHPSVDPNFIFKVKYWESSKMVEVKVAQSQLIVQYYGHTVASIASGELRGKMCGLCGDFNGETSDENLITKHCFAL